MDRYAGKPFLRLLECYLLRAIDGLSPEQVRSLEALEPHLQSTYSMTGRWFEIVAAVMDLPSDFPDTVRQMWNRNQEIARNASVTLSHFDFVVMFLDTNFPFVNDAPSN